MKSLTDKQRAYIADVMRRLREHYFEWPNYEGHECELMQFAHYEGCDYRSECCIAILAEAAPIVLGQELVARHGFQWIMLPSGQSWRYGVEHPALDRPIDLAALKDGSWNDEEYDEAQGESRMTIDSLETIVRRVRKSTRNTEPKP